MSKANAKTKSMQVYGYTAMDNRIFFLQERLTPNAFCLLIRIYRMTEGYDGKPKALANTYLQTLCNMSKNTVTKSLKELEDMKLLFVKKRPRATTIYLVNLKQMYVIFDELRQEAESCFPEYDHEMNNDDSQDMTQCFPRYDHVDGQNMGATKENVKKTLLKKTAIENPINSFDDFWNAYDYKKGGLDKPKKKWASLSESDKQLIMDNVPAYVKSTPDKKFRKHPMTYLNNQGWLDELPQVKPDKLAVNKNWSGANKSNIVAPNTSIEDMLGDYS